MPTPRRFLSDLLRDPEIGKAVEDLKISGFTDAELRAYDKFWDAVSVERTLQYDSYQQGMEKGMEKGMEEGMKQGMACCEEAGKKAKEVLRLLRICWQKAWMHQR